MNLQAQYIVGFTDGVGCFHVGVSKQSSYETGYQILPEFTVTQHKRDIKILYALKSYFKCGVVRHNNKNAYSYRVRKRDHLVNIIVPFFEKHTLKTLKNVDFRKFRKVLLLMEKSEHLNPEGFEKIMNILERKKNLLKIESDPSRNTMG